MRDRRFPELATWFNAAVEAGLVLVCDLVILELTRLAPNERRAREVAERLAAFEAIPMPGELWVYYRDPDGVEPVADFLDREFPLEPRKKNPSSRELQAAATKRMTVDLQIDRLNRLANDDPPLPFPHTSQVDGPLRWTSRSGWTRSIASRREQPATMRRKSVRRL